MRASTHPESSACTAGRQRRVWRQNTDLGRDKFAEFGFSIVLYANAALQAALKASYEVLKVLKSEGSLQSVGDRLASFEERQRVVAKDEWDAREARYRV